MHIPRALRADPTNGLVKFQTNMSSNFRWRKKLLILARIKKSAFKNWKMLKIFKFFNKFEVFSFKNWRHNFFHKTVSFQNKMKNFINFILFCLTCILNTLYPDYQNSNEQNILFPRFYTLMSIFWESFFLMENF